MPEQPLQPLPPVVVAPPPALPPAPDPLQPNPVLPTPTPKSHKGMVMGILAAVLVVLGAATWFGYQLLIPSTPQTSTTTTETTTNSPEPSPTPVATGPACLAPTAVAPLTNGEAFYHDNEGIRSYAVDTYFFTADSTDYAYPDLMTGDLDEVADVFKAQSATDITIHLSGKVKESASTSGGEKLAQERAQKIKDELITRGIPAKRIIIDEPQFASSNYADGSERNVDLTFESVPC